MRILGLCLFMLSFVFGNAQTMQIKFCGKTSAVVPATDGSGQDQRNKGGLRMDFIRIGKLSQSRTSPFYTLGLASGTSFKNATWVDGCANNTNQTYCSGCSTCKPILNTSNGSIGVSEGKMVENVRLRTSNNDLYIESTGSQNVVCFVTDPIDLSSVAGKKIEVNVGYEGTVKDGFTTVNVNFNYRYNNEAWANLLNQNSNFLRVIDTAILVNINVPTAVVTLDETVDFKISPNPVNNKLFIELNSLQTFDAELSIRDIQGKIVLQQNYAVSEGTNRIDWNIEHLNPAIYLFQIADKEGRISTSKFIKE